MVVLENIERWCDQRSITDDTFGGGPVLEDLRSAERAELHARES